MNKPLIKSDEGVCRIFVFLLFKIPRARVTVKIKENSKQAKLLLEYMKSLSFVEFIDSNKATSPKSKKELFLEDIEKSLREVKKIREGKLTPLSVKDLLDE